MGSSHRLASSGLGGSTATRAPSIADLLPLPLRGTLPEGIAHLGQRSRPPAPKFTSADFNAPLTHGLNCAVPLVSMLYIVKVANIIQDPRERLAWRA